MGNRRETQVGLIGENETRGSKTRYADIGNGTVKVKREMRESQRRRLDTET